MVNSTYLLIINPTKTLPKAFPMTAGIRYAPAATAEALAVTWKYHGTENRT